jgi:hypothetical protein
MIWKNDNLYYLDNNLEFYCRHAVKSTKIRWIVFKLTLIASGTGTHANIIIYDKKTGILERFEPYGIIPYMDNDKIDKVIKDRIGKFLSKNTNKKLEFVGPKDMYKDIGFQIISHDSEFSMKKYGDPRGFCLAWTFWYLEMRIKNSKLHPRDLVRKSIKKIKQKGSTKNNEGYEDHTFINFIRNYAADLDNRKNKMMTKFGIGKMNHYNNMHSINDNNKILSSLMKILENNVNSW